MKKHLATMLAAMAVLGTTTVFAANPFSDVTPDSWAYQSVSQLASAGIINGYPDGTFKGQKDITRFEMAQMIAKAMANQDRANAEQQAMINRLADEFSNELNNLGVRVARLEDRTGNVKVSGDVQFLLRHSFTKNGVLVGQAGQYYKPSKFDIRGRVQFNAKVNDRTDVVARFRTYQMEFGDGGEYESTPTLDRGYVNHQFGKHTSVKVGRFNQVIGNGLLYDDTFDGIQFNTGNDRVQLQLAHGYATAEHNETRFLPERDQYNY
ncbi:MAG: S-layer homology domain-containing protein, partial [Veillonella sp.]|nr:S-layer homology domain-containing protein [Veillonella sp.]